MFKGYLEFVVVKNGESVAHVRVDDKMMIRVGADKNAELRFDCADRMLAIIEFEPWKKESHIELMHLGGMCPIHVHDMCSGKTQRFMQSRTKLRVGDWFEIGGGGNNCVQFRRFVNDTAGFDVQMDSDRYFQRPVNADPVVAPKAVDDFQRGLRGASVPSDGGDAVRFAADLIASMVAHATKKEPSPAKEPPAVNAVDTGWLPSPQEADVRKAFNRIAMLAAERLHIVDNMEASQTLVGDSMLVASVISKYFALMDASKASR